MRVAVALLGIAAAAFYGSYAYFAPGGSRTSQLAEVTRIVTAPQVSSADSEPGRAGPRVFSPQSPLVSPEPQRAAAAAPVREVAPQRTPELPAVIAMRRSDPFADVPVVQAVQPRAAAANLATQAAQGAQQPARKPTSQKPSTEEARVALVRDLQRELKRVGCYDGEITGSWGPGSKRAMGSFTGRVNASLPVEEPDYVLLALLQGYSGQTCGGGCPDGQAIASDGRCLPRAIVAQTGARPASRPEPRATVAETGAARAPSASGWTTTVDSRSRAATAEVPLDQRAAAMANQLASAPFPARPRSQDAGFGDRSALAQPPAPGAALATAAPLPGRMSIGAPVTGPGATAPLATGEYTTTAVLPPDEASGDYGIRTWEGAALPPDRLPRIRGGETGRSSPSRRARYDYAPPRSNYARSGRSGQLRSSAQVRDFFFGAGRSSF